MQHPLLSAFSSVIGMAQSRVEDIETGIDDGTYCGAENADLPAKHAALTLIEYLFASLQEKESGLNDLISAALRFNTSQIVSALGSPIDTGVLDTRERIYQQIDLSTNSVSIVRELVAAFGQAVGEDSDINGADAVDVIFRLVTQAQLALKAPAVTNAIAHYKMEDWQQEVAAGDTRLGFDDWQQHRVEADRILRSCQDITFFHPWGFDPLGRNSLYK